ncbi:cell division protein FtsQ/DivIB [Limosilactobacillus pontis]|uniref:cell division protein FtsQ/DivIB n=1 Tax=Limosilactobacillus pontis TaxID=35787 RepID=UPI001D35403F|nr:cell division protein FtsQ/DivIB [Limosilactobacillus pontis]HJE26559.1 FtsQ-type POTRA domain-containing protein [Limosilactobacillus pontis]
MTRDHYVSEHQRYAKRLAELEERSRQAHQQRQQPNKKHISKRLPRLRHHHYRKNSERVFKLVLVFGLVLLLMAYIISPLSKLSSVKVVGNKELTATNVEDAVKVYPGRFIWGVYLNRGKLCRQARVTQPRIASAKIRVTGLQSMTVTVRENPLLGTARLGKQVYAVLADGHLQVTTMDSTGIDYRQFNGHRADLQLVARQIGKLKPAIRSGISAIVYQPTKQMPNRIVLYMRDGNTVLANKNTVGTKMAYYPGIAANMKQNGVVDLQVGAFSYDYGAKDK